MKLSKNTINYTLVILVLTILGLGCGDERTERLPTEDMIKATPSTFDLANGNNPEWIFIEFAPFDTYGDPITDGTGVFVLNTGASSQLALDDESGPSVGFDLEDEGVAEAWLIPSTVPEVVVVYAYAAVYPYDIVAHCTVRIIDSNLLRADFSYAVDSGLVVHFHNESAAGGAALTYAWDFDGDGVTDSAVENPNYTFPEAGYYDVSLTVNNGVISDSTNPVTITVTN